MPVTKSVIQTHVQRAGQSWWVILLFAAATALAGCATTNSSPSTPPPDAPKMYGSEWKGYDQLYVGPDEMPELYGGLRSLVNRLTTLKGNTRCPSGRIIVKFIVGETGTVLETTTVAGQGHPCETLAVRVVRESSFTPGMEDGSPVKTVMSLPVTFR